MSYTAMDRFRDCLEGEPRDRVPIFPMCAGWVAAHFSEHPLPRVASDPKLLADAQIKAIETLGHDALYSYVDPLYIPEAFGCKVRYLTTGPILDPLPLKIKEAGDIDQIPRPDATGEGRLPVIREAVKGLATYGDGNLPVIGLFEGPFTTAARVIEAEQIMRMIYKNRGVLEDILDRMTDFLLSFGRALIDSGANVLFIPEPTASSTMISPLMFRELVLPLLRRLTGSLDVPCILHICGDTSLIVDTMAQTGAAVLSLDQCMDLRKTREKAPKAVLGGNVDPSGTLAFGSREQVVEDTLKCLHAGGKRGFVLMTGCGIPPSASVENVKTMISTAKEYGLGGKQIIR